MPEPGGAYRDLKPFFRLLDTVGDGTGDDNAAQNYAITPATFRIIPAANEVIILEQLLVHISDNSSFAPTGYGGRAALGNGYQIIATMPNMNAENLLANGDVIKHNDDFLHWGPGALDLIKFTGGADSSVGAYRAVNFGVDFVLDGSQGHKIEITLNDDFSTLVDHHFIVHGRI